MDYHEYANLFPMMSQDEMRELCADMQAGGYDKTSPIVLYNGKILDGRNRQLAADTVGVAPAYIAFDGDDKAALDFVIRHNLKRRHLNETQRAIVASKLANIGFGEFVGNQHTNQGYANLHTPKVSRADAAAMLNVSPRTVATVKAIERAAPELMEQMERGEITASHANKIVKTAEAHRTFTAQTNQSIVITPTVEVCDAGAWLEKMPMCDLLLTDPPYSTDVENIGGFARWLTLALSRVRATGRAYVFIGAYPNEVAAYLALPEQIHMKLEQMLVWTYKNTLGNNPKDRYKLNYQFCLYYKGVDAPDLNCPLTAEQWAVMEMNAPDGRLGDRYHTWQKPLELAEMLIRHSTQVGQTVYDPFTCTGTFLLAASKLGRIGRGCDISRDNLSIAVERGCKYA